MRYTFGLLGTGVGELTFGRQACRQTTPQQTEGPFYPVTKYYSDDDWNLTHVRGHKNSARGTPIVVEGTVQDQCLIPVENAVVEIWQACASGRYKHPGDRSENALDPNFQYWGFTKTDEKGHYLFYTIEPGHYAVNDTWTRPPHIHFKIHQRGFGELTTQLYFQGHPLNADDLILRKIPEDERVRVIRSLQSISSNSTTDLSLAARKRVIFDIQIKKI
ncbi:MAG: protocatechuate 3,4-dioxygenase [Methylococcales bacterium]